MVITLYTAEIINSLRTISHREVAEIADVEARYRAEAGSEKTGEIYSCIEDAAARLSGRCARFLAGAYSTGKDNLHSLPAEYVFEFTLSERRAVNKAAPLTEAMDTFVVEYALSKFYSMVSQGDLSNKHSLLAIDAGNQIAQLLYTKQPPIV
jgi:hypothetical protein